MKASELKVGDTIEYRGAFGLDPITTAKVLGFDEKNGRDLVFLDDDHWAYLHQVKRITIRVLS